MAQAVVAVSMFGKDHWSMFAYLETCCVDGKAGWGRLAPSRMRTNGQKRPELAENVPWRAKFGTRLQSFFELVGREDPELAAAAGLQLLDHDDWDCLADLEAAGFVVVAPGERGQARLTELGFAVAAEVRKHKASGHQFSSFVWRG